ncbi:protein kinase [Pseudomonas sp. HAR-UPW-AIA-41]|uniref:leucine-rich repeat-containing protein kinase family protein n=1 Tax=Pseudomonas sp. HAR-UPW-AIA-41 TaxID=1985301 RepID=UPI000BB37EE9|nr:leucine-rich repeat-containing protein kinase family protein [Pseudomonas sp. HAR-UPW-AIA-41]PAV47425.1 protein kinase [Pseudomonas sp. HAR-UPW-AIA-41]
MHSLEQLRRGELTGITRLDLSADLVEFPREIFDLADSLEVLNLSGNHLSSLPDDLPRLHRLRILFCSENAFTQMPAVLGQCPQLEMVGFKSNAIEHLPAAALPPKLRWLILTDNRLTHLPAELGQRQRLQKLMLAGNQLRELPDSLAQLHNLELLRIAANRLEQLPAWLLQLPRLSWLAFAGNPCSDHEESLSLARHPHPPVPRSQLALGELLGQGASGLIHRATWQVPGQVPRAMAVKLFKGAVTSDGLPHSEMAACLAAEPHANLARVVGPLQQEAGQPDGLLLELIDPRYQVLAGPPSLASCTRDVYAKERCFSPDQALRIARGVASAVAQLHGGGILHGDLYAHNLLVDAAGDCLLSDFGAASFFAPDSAEGLALQRLEVRAFGCLLEELLQRSDASLAEALEPLLQRCLHSQPDRRPLFAEISRILQDV